MKLPSPQEVLQRSVHIKMHPRPRSLMESREVLRALEQFGTIASFYHLKYDPKPAANTALATFHTADAARRAIEKEVLKISNGHDAPDPVTNLSPPPLPASSTPHDLPLSPTGTQIVIRPARSPPDARAVRRPYYWPYFLEPSDAPGAGMLGPDVPRGLRGATCLSVGGPEISVKMRRKAEGRWERERDERGWGSLGELWRLGEERRKKSHGERREGQKEGHEGVGEREAVEKTISTEPSDNNADCNPLRRSIHGLGN